MMFFNLLGNTESGNDLRSEKSNTSKKEASEYWYMLLTKAISANTKKRIAPRLAAGRYPSRNLSISIDVFAANLNFSNT